VLSVFERVVLPRAEALEGLFLEARPKTQEGWSRLEPGLSLFVERARIQSGTAAPDGGGSRRATLIGGPRFLTRVQHAELRRQLADVNAKLRQLCAAKRGRWR
jgi:hypothetical protein